MKKLYFLALTALVSLAQAQYYRTDFDTVYHRAYNLAYDYTHSRSTSKKAARKMVKRYKRSNRTVNHFIGHGLEDQVYRYCNQITQPVTYGPVYQTEYVYRPACRHVRWSPCFYEPCYVVKRKPSVGFSFGNRKFGFGFNIPLK